MQMGLCTHTMHPLGGTTKSSQGHLNKDRFIDVLFLLFVLPSPFRDGSPRNWRRQRSGWKREISWRRSSRRNPRKQRLHQRLRLWVELREQLLGLLRLKLRLTIGKVIESQMPEKYALKLEHYIIKGKVCQIMKNIRQLTEAEESERRSYPSYYQQGDSN